MAGATNSAPRGRRTRAGHALRDWGLAETVLVRRRWGDSNSRGASTPTSLAGRRTRPLCDISGCRIGPMSLPQGAGRGQTRSARRPARVPRPAPPGRPVEIDSVVRGRRCHRLPRTTLSISTPEERQRPGKRIGQAERGGFEPPVRQAYSGFQDRHIRPLCHLSTPTGPARGQAQTLPPRRVPPQRPLPASSSSPPGGRGPVRPPGRAPARAVVVRRGAELSPSRRIPACGSAGPTPESARRACPGAPPPVPAPWPATRADGT